MDAAAGHSRPLRFRATGSWGLRSPLPSLSVPPRPGPALGRQQGLESVGALGRRLHRPPLCCCPPRSARCGAAGGGAQRTASVWPLPCPPEEERGAGSCPPLLPSQMTLEGHSSPRAAFSPGTASGPGCPRVSQGVRCPLVDSHPAHAGVTRAADDLLSAAPAGSAGPARAADRAPAVLLPRKVLVFTPLRRQL